VFVTNPGELYFPHATLHLACDRTYFSRREELLYCIIIIIKTADRQHTAK